MQQESLAMWLADSEFIDCQHHIVMQKAAELAAGKEHINDIAKACFEFVRDDIKHSWDFKLDTITCKASDVLLAGTGYCYAKSHLLAALLRANQIPAGLCYQRLTIDHQQPPFCLHGLNAVYLPKFGWYRIDARGNNSSVNAQFTPPQEQLAFALLTEGEQDVAGIFHSPLPVVIETLTQYQDCQAVMDHLPDMDEDAIAM